MKETINFDKTNTDSHGMQISAVKVESVGDHQEPLKKAVGLPVGSVGKKRWEKFNKPLEKNCNPLEFFAHPLKVLDKPLKPLENPLTTRWLDVGIYLFNGKPLLYVFA